jgi:hypothetical protein
MSSCKIAYNLSMYISATSTGKNHAVNPSMEREQEFPTCLLMISFMNSKRSPLA